MTGTILIRNGIVVTVDSRNTIYEKGSVLVEGGQIVDVGETDKVEKGCKPDIVIDAEKKVVLPGLINTHLHSGLIRGTAEDLPLWERLRKHVDPEHKALESDDAYAASLLCCPEMTKAGITCALDMYRYTDRCADAAEQVGIGAVFAPYVADKPSFDYFEKLQDNERLVRTRHGSTNGRINVRLGLEHLIYCSEEAFRKAREYADKYGVGIHTHGEEATRRLMTCLSAGDHWCPNDTLVIR